MERDRGNGPTVSVREREPSRTFDPAHDTTMTLRRGCDSTFAAVTDTPAERTRWAAEYQDADYPLQDLTGRIIAAFLHVHHTHGYGFLESVYRKALAIELEHRGIPIEQLARYELFHRGLPIGVYEADLVADRSVILETKTGLILDPVAEAQLLNYLRASRLRVGLVLHFGPRPIIKRVVSSNRYARIGTSSETDAYDR